MHPIAFKIGGVVIHWYGVLMLIAFGASFWTACTRAQHKGLGLQAIRGAAFALIAGAIIGARLLYVTAQWDDEFADEPLTNVLRFWQGHIFYGGLIGGITGVILYSWWRKLSFWSLADAIAPSVLLGTVFGRLACLMAGCCWGRESSVPWAIHFGAKHPTHNLDVHPVQVYHALLAAVLYYFLERSYRRKRFEGQVFSLMLLSYAATRPFIEIFRGDYAPSEYYCGLTPGQWMSVPLFLIGFIIYWRKSQALASNCRSITAPENCRDEITELVGTEGVVPQPRFWNWLGRLLLLVLAVVPFIYWQPFYQHFVAYLTGTILTKVIKGQWQLVLASLLMFMAFAIPLTYRRRTKWVDYSLVGAFFVSLFVEMYGIPITILFASKYFFMPTVHLPKDVVAIEFLGVLTTMDHAMTYGTVLILLGMSLIAGGWYSLYRQARSGGFAQGGLYAVSRNPQYLGFILIVAGWFFGWPTPLTVIFCPILIFKYIRAAQAEEKEMIALWGEPFLSYCKRTPFLL